MKLTTLPVYDTADPAAGAGAAAKAGNDPASAAVSAGNDPGAAAAKTVTTALDLDPAKVAAVASPAAFPEDWRARFAGGDAKVLERLGRYTSPEAFAKAGIEAQAKILSGKPDADAPMPDPEKDAEGAKKWREERGIPADPTGYALPEEVTKKLTDEDKPILESFTTAAHKANLPPAAVKVAAEWYTGLVETQAAAQKAADTKQAGDVQEALRGKWGTDFLANNGIAQKFAQESIPGVAWFQARLPDGRALGNVPEVVEAFAELGRLKWGDIAFAGGAQAKVSEGRMAELKNIMDTKFEVWEASPALRKEYNELLAAADKRPKQ